MIRILLCTGSVKENGDNKNIYQESLLKNGFSCEILPVLEFEFTNLAKLKNSLLQGKSYGGLILTSPRSALALSLLKSQDLNFSFENIWKELPTFCIGHATESVAKTRLNFTKILGTDTGNSKNLANYIVDTFDKNSKPLLLPCSDIARDTISQILQENGIKVEKIIVYKTRPHQNLGEKLHKALGKDPNALVFFSPSTVNFVISKLNNFEETLKNKKIIAIGPTTEQALMDMGINVDATAERPESESLLDQVKILFK